jgi:hypothetical protein
VHLVVAGQATPDKLLLVAPEAFWLGWIVQRDPCQLSANVTSVLLLSVE